MTTTSIPSRTCGIEAIEIATRFINQSINQSEIVVSGIRVGYFVPKDHFRPESVVEDAWAIHYEQPLSGYSDEMLEDDGMPVPIIIFVKAVTRRAELVPIL